MNVINYRVSLDLFDTLSQTTIKAKKGDSACKIHITLIKNGKIFNIGEGCHATFNAKKSDGNFIYDNCTIEGDTIVYDFTSSIDENGACQVSAIEGNVDCEVTLYNSKGEQLTSPRFTLYIDGVIYNGEEIISSPESDVLKGLITEAGDLIEEMEDLIEQGGGGNGGNSESAIIEECSGMVRLKPNVYRYHLISEAETAMISEDISLFPVGYRADIIFFNPLQDADQEALWNNPIQTSILKDVSDRGMPLSELTIGVGNNGVHIHIYKVEDADKFNWYLSTEMSGADCISPTIYVGEEEPTDDNVSVWINPNGDKTSLKDEELPKVFFSGNINPMTKDNPVELDISYRSDTENFDGYVEIKWQGSSSIAYPKKNYTIKMFNNDGTKLKKDFCGWGEQNKFCLKANYVDATHARNIISARLWGDVISSREDYDSLPVELRTSPNNGAIDGFPFKLYMNGQYQGIYTWNIPKDAWMWNMDKDNALHNVLCAEINSVEPHTCNFNVPWSGVDGDGWSYEAGEPSDDVTQSLNNLINYVLNCPDETFKESLGMYLDIQSAIDYYIHQLTIYGKDNMAKNMLLATYDRNKWYMGAYDMDSTFGMEWDGSRILPANTPIEGGYQANDSLLWDRISTLYANEITERYAELRKTIYTVSNMVTMFERFMDSIGKDLYAEDIMIFPDIPSAEITNIRQIRSFISERLAFIDKQLLPPIPIYQLRNSKVFDGTNYIDTGVDLDDEEEYTVMCDYTLNELPESRGLLIDRFDTNTGIGWGVQYQATMAYGGMWTEGWTDIAFHGWDCSNPVGMRNKIIIRKKADGTISLFTHHGESNLDASVSIQEGETSRYVTLGAKCWVSENGKSYDSFIKATMHDCKIYDVALSDEECNAYVGEV